MSLELRNPFGPVGIAPPLLGALRPGHVLVVVARHGHPDEVRDVLQRHGGRLVAKPSHLS